MIGDLKVVQVLSEKGVTFNRDKCQYTMSQLGFMGHVLSAHGIRLAEA